MTGPLEQLLETGRAAHQQLMVDTCSISRPGPPVLDRTTSHLTPGSSAVLYAGSCRIKAQRIPRDKHAFERLTVTARYEVALPFTARPAVPLQVGDVLTVTSSGDARLVGQAMAVMAIDFGSTTTAWRLTVEAVT